MRGPAVSLTEPEENFHSSTIHLTERLAFALSSLCGENSISLLTLTSSLRLCAALLSQRTKLGADFVHSWGHRSLPLSNLERQRLHREWSALIDQLIIIDPFWSPLHDAPINETGVLLSLCQQLSPLTDDLQSPLIDQHDDALLDLYQSTQLTPIAAVYETLLSAHAQSTQDLEAKQNDREQGGHFSKVLGDLRRSSGTHYTPRELCREVIETAAHPLISRINDLSDSQRFDVLRTLSICDPAMGSGAFIIESILWLSEQLTLCSEVSRKRCLTYAAEQVYGVDIDAFAVEFTQFRVRELTQGEHDPTHQLRCGDTLIGHSWSRSIQKKAYTARSTCSHPHFNWAHAFPKVDQRGGFDLIVGNPPFLGGRQCAAVLGSSYTARLHRDYPESQKSADLCAFFVRRSASLCHPEGAIGLITTNTIAQGSTRESGLAYLVKAGYSIFAAWRRRQWPSAASVKVSLIFLKHGSQSVNSTAKWLNGRPVKQISSLLNESDIEESPPRLQENRGRCLQGSIVLGMGFTFDDHNRRATPLSEMNRLIDEDPQRSQLIKPYMGGRELNTDPMHRAHRYVIDFGESSLKEAESWPDLLNIVRTKVSENRIKHRNPAIRTYPWWRHWNPRTGLYKRLKNQDFVLLTNAQAAAHLTFVFVPAERIFANSLNILPEADMAEFAILQSRVHEQWAWLFASTLGDQIRYNPTDCYETFPRPHLSTSQHKHLSKLGEAYHHRRAKLMSDPSLRAEVLDGSPPEGLTATYNRFHNPHCTLDGIKELRDLHAAIDYEVLKSYGWSDLSLRYAWVDHFSHRQHQNTPSHMKEDDALWRLNLTPPLRDQILNRLYALSLERANTN